ncbi:MAG: methionine gamma-lyase family protein [Oscillospiraceae bacterium]
MINEQINFSDELLKLSAEAEKNCLEAFARTEEIAFFNEQKVLNAFVKNRVSESHLQGSTGYGYGDRGRDVLDQVFADALGAEDALVRHNFVSGTHALTVSLFGVLRTNDKMVSITGLPYDTMQEVIGIRGNGNGSLKDYGIDYQQVDLTKDGKPDIPAIKKAVVGAKVAYIQRSRGYSLRESLTIAAIENLIKACREVNKDVIVIVDNCYGEFVEKVEPTAVGADLIIGSLIKNAGGGIAKTGGYIAGRKDLVKLCSYRLTCVGMGKEVGCSLEENRAMFMGLFVAPSVVCNALKTSIFALSLFTNMGFKTYPEVNAIRTDIIAAIELKSRENMMAFCKGIQAGSPIDSFVTPEPWEMPGYEDDVIMAAGAFTNGASIELSADGPMREPFAVWLQGGLTYNTGKIGILLAAKEILKK